MAVYNDFDISLALFASLASTHAVIMSIIRSSRNPRLPQLQPLSAVQSHPKKTPPKKNAVATVPDRVVLKRCSTSRSYLRTFGVALYIFGLQAPVIVVSFPPGTAAAALGPDSTASGTMPTPVRQLRHHFYFYYYLFCDYFSRIFFPAAIDVALQTLRRYPCSYDNHSTQSQHTVTAQSPMLVCHTPL